MSIRKATSPVNDADVDPPDGEEENDEDGDEDEDDDDDDDLDEDEDDDDDDAEAEGVVASAEDVAKSVTMACREALENQDSVTADKRRILLDLDDGSRWVLTVKRRD
jgi:hypothetical protein